MGYRNFGEKFTYIWSNNNCNILTLLSKIKLNWWHLIHYSVYCQIDFILWTNNVRPLKGISHTSQKSWPCNCEDPWFPSKAVLPDMICWTLCQIYLLEMGLCHTPVSHKNNTIMNAHETSILRTLKLCTLYDYNTIMWLLWARTTYPTIGERQKDDPLSSSELSLVFKGTPSLIHLYP